MDRLLGMEAGPLAEPAPPAVGERLKESLGRPWMVAVLVIAAIFLALVIAKGLHAVAQTGLNGLSLGSIYALGAVGLTLVYGILKLVNFAQGDFLTFGAYMAYLPPRCSGCCSSACSGGRCGPNTPGSCS